MNTVTIRTLGLPWLAALACTALALLALAGQVILPPGALRGAVPGPSVAMAPAAPPDRAADPAPTGTADLYNTLVARERAALREQISAIRALLTPTGGDPDTLAVSQARARLAALIAAQDQPAQTPSALVLTSMMSRFDAAVASLRQAGAAPLAAPLTDNMLLKVAVSLALGAALLALFSGPLALAPAQLLCASLGQAGGGRAIWGTERRDEWGMLARQAAASLRQTDHAPQHAAFAAPTEQLRETAEAMSRLLLDSGQELARMRGEAGEAVNNAVMLGARLADAVLDAESRLQSRTQRGQLGWEPAEDAATAPAAARLGYPDPAALWSAASAHADKLEEAASRALAAATVLPAAADRIEKAITGLDRMSITVAANSEGLADLAARAGAAAAMLPEAAQRIETAASGLAGVASRTSSAASVLPQAAQLIAQASSDLGRAAEAVATNAASLTSAAARHTDAASTLPDVVRSIETAVSGLDRAAKAVDDASDHVRITSRTAAATVATNEASQRALCDAAQRMAEFGEQLPHLAGQITDATETLQRGAGTVVQAADRVEGTSRAIATLVAGAESAQTAMSGAALHIMALGEQLPNLGSQVAAAIGGLDHAAGVIAQAADRTDETSRAVAALAAGAESAQATLTGAVQRLASVGEELPGIAYQIADATSGLDRSATAVAVAADRAEQFSRSVTALAASAEEVQHSCAAAVGQVTAASAALPQLTQRIELAVNTLDGTTEVVVAAQTTLTASLPQMTALSEKLPAAARRIEEVVDALDGGANLVIDAANAALTAQANLSGTVEGMTTLSQGLPDLSARLLEQIGRIEERMNDHRLEDQQAGLAATAYKLAELASGMEETLPSLSTRIDSAVTDLESSAASLAMIGASAGEALPAAASRIDEALSGLDATVQVIAEAAANAAASFAESAGTQSSLAQTVQCMASVGEALPSLAMRLEGTLGALDRSTDSLVAAANDVAEAGRRATGAAPAAEDNAERRPPRPAADTASLRRLQSVASALAMSANGQRS